jgi:hypothetical protein
MKLLNAGDHAFDNNVQGHSAHAVGNNVQGHSAHAVGNNVQGHSAHAVGNNVQCHSAHAVASYYRICLSVILHEISKRKANWIGHILRRNCLIRQVIEGKIKGGIEVAGRRGRRHRKLLDELKEMRGYSHLKEEALDRTMLRAGFGPVVRQTAN